MFKKTFFLSVVMLLGVTALAQNTNSSATGTRGRRSAQARPTPTPDAATTSPDQTTPAGQTGTGPTTRPRGASVARTSPTERAVREVFDTLVDGIRRASVETVMSVYWNSPQLVLFNNNGTVTRGWDQVRSNRASSYPNLKDVKLDVRDVRVHVLGPDSAFVSCLWTQTQTVRDAQESASGRLTLAFQRIGGAWKIVHTHTSPDRPDPSLIPPSERTTEPAGRPPVKP